MEPIINDMYNPPIETQERINNLVRNGVFKDIQEFTNKAIEKFLNEFDHAKINPQKTQESVCKFRVHAESMDDLLENLHDNGVKGHFNVILVDYCKIDNGDIEMYTSKRGDLFMVFEVDIYEKNPFFEDGKEYTYF